MHHSRRATGAPAWVLILWNRNTACRCPRHFSSTHTTISTTRPGEGADRENLKRSDGVNGGSLREASNHLVSNGHSKLVHPFTVPSVRMSPTRTRPRVRVSAVGRFRIPQCPHTPGPHMAQWMAVHESASAMSVEVKPLFLQIVTRQYQISMVHITPRYWVDRRLTSLVPRR